MKNRKRIVVLFLLVAIMLIGVGYAAVSDTLTIIGNAHIDMGQVENTFDKNVYFSGAEATSTSGTGTVADVTSFTADDATFTANKLAIVNEVSTFTFTITNDSNVDAKVTINDKKLSNADNPSNSNPDKFTVAYSYPDGMTIAKNGGTITVVVTVTVKAPVTTATSATFGIELTVTSAE